MRCSTISVYKSPHWVMDILATCFFVKYPSLKTLVAASRRGRNKRGFLLSFLFKIMLCPLKNQKDLISFCCAHVHIVNKMVATAMVQQERKRKTTLYLSLSDFPYRNDKVVTTLAQGCHNAFLQPCHNLGTTLYFETVARL